MSLQSIINLYPSGTTFCLASGTYPVPTAIFPKANDRFIAVQPRQAVLTGNDVTSMAFSAAGASGVEVNGLVITHFNPPLGGGNAALKAASGWRIINSEIAYSANDGVYLESNTIMQGNYIHHNQHSGIQGNKANNSLITDNEIAFNGAGGALNNGGAKWYMTANLTVSSNYWHDNSWTDIWLDTSITGALIEGNTIYTAHGHAIDVEISDSRSSPNIFRNNVISVSSTGRDGILINASSGQQVDGNTISFAGIDPWGKAIHLFADAQRSVDLTSNTVRNNVVTLVGGNSNTKAAGIDCYLIPDCSPYYTVKGNTFTGDSYKAPSGKYWQLGSYMKTITEWQAAGFD